MPACQLNYIVKECGMLGSEEGLSSQKNCFVCTEGPLQGASNCVLLTRWVCMQILGVLYVIGTVM